MKCTCDECGGAGVVTCDGCDGTGSVEGADFSTLPIDPKHRNHAELVALKADLARVRKAANELEALNPARANSYRQQLAAAVVAIEWQAEKALKP